MSVFKIGQNTTEPFVFTLRGRDQQPVRINTALAVRLTIKRKFGAKLLDAVLCEILDDGTPAMMGKARYTPAPTAEAGDFPGYAVVTYSDSSTQRFPSETFTYRVTPA